MLEVGGMTLRHCVKEFILSSELGDPRNILRALQQQAPNTEPEWWTALMWQEHSLSPGSTPFLSTMPPPLGCKERRTETPADDGTFSSVKVQTLD